MAQVITKLRQKDSEGVFQQEIPIGTSADQVVCANGDRNLPLQDQLEQIKGQLEELSGTIEWEEV